jgi:hypothetical protein
MELVGAAFHLPDRRQQSRETENTMIPINEESSRIARHEPGARLQGETVGALFIATGTSASQAHLGRASSAR